MKIKLIILSILILILSLPLFHEKTAFILGAAFVDIGYILQDKANDFDLKKHKFSEITPEEVWTEFIYQNKLASKIKKAMPLHDHHPVIAILVCMDARLDIHQITGDTRHYYYVVRTAGSIMNIKEEEMLELAVENGVKVVIITTHTDCSAEKAAANSESRLKYPAISKAIEERNARIQEFKGRPFIAKKIQSGELLVKNVLIDTSSEEVFSIEK